MQNPADQTDFDAIAEVYDGVFAPHIREHYLHRRADHLLRNAPGQRALDVGAGTGILAERLTHRGLSVVALDPYPQMLEQLQQRQPAVETVVAHGQEIPFPNDTFDLTYSVAVMHHIADSARVRQTIAEMVRVTRPGGRIVIWDHNPLNPYWPIIMRRVPQDNGTERLIPMGELLGGLTAAGAEILRAEHRSLMPDFVPERLMPLARAVERMVETTPGARRFCAHNVVVARKP
ncbi:MAG: methyltransferase domain-containing protein [Thermomicrobiales bacterium]|nr:methyltransferase domain-containing protein [Thermomicrobiales bacterium]